MAKDILITEQECKLHLLDKIEIDYYSLYPWEQLFTKPEHISENFLQATIQIAKERKELKNKNNENKSDSCNC